MVSSLLGVVSGVDRVAKAAAFDFFSCFSGLELKVFEVGGLRFSVALKPLFKLGRALRQLSSKLPKIAERTIENLSFTIPEQSDCYTDFERGLEQAQGGFQQT